MAGMSMGPNGLAGGSGTSGVMAADMTNIYSSNTFTMNTSATTVFQQSTGDGSYPAVNLTHGTYLVVITWDRNGDGAMYSSHWTGLMFWYGYGTNAGETSDIPLHGSAHSFNSQYMYARTQMTYGNNNNLRFQVWATTTGTNDNFNVYVKRLS